MSERTKNQFKPNFAVPPGETLLEKIEELGMTQSELASRMGRPLKTINEIIKGKAAITPETALQLEKVTGIDGSFWNNAEANFRESLARLAEQSRIAEQTDWLKNFSIKALIQHKWLPEVESKEEQVAALLRFLGIASHEQWEANSLIPKGGAFRESSSFKSKPGDLSAWIRAGQLAAMGLECAPYDGAAFRNALKEIRKLTAGDFITAWESTRRLVAECGVACVIIPELPKTHVSGFTRWLTPDRALIQQSARHKSDDHLWFTFFHESAHILLHGKRQVFIEDGGGDDPKEAEADEWARNFLISPKVWDEFIDEWRDVCASLFDSRQRIKPSAERNLSKAVATFAREIEIAPGIVVGRLQREKLIPYNALNRHKRKLAFSK